MYTRVKQYLGRKIIKNFYITRFCSTDQSHIDRNEPKPFEEIPGPRSLPIIGTLYKYLPFIGKKQYIIMMLDETFSF